MVMASLAWNLKAWLALWTPPSPGRWHARHIAEQEEILRMEFRTFVSFFIRIPCQIINTGRKLVYRLLAWNAWQATFCRMAPNSVDRSAAEGQPSVPKGLRLIRKMASCGFARRWCTGMLARQPRRKNAGGGF